MNYMPVVHVQKLYIYMYENYNVQVQKPNKCFLWRGMHSTDINKSNHNVISMVNTWTGLNDTAQSSNYLAPRGGCEVLFSPGLSVCVSVCVRPIFWYFISRLLEEISIWNLCRIFIGWYSIHWKNIDLHRSMVKVTETVHCFLKVQSYHKNWALEKLNFFFIDNS